MQHSLQSWGSLQPTVPRHHTMGEPKARKPRLRQGLQYCCSLYLCIPGGRRGRHPSTWCKVGMKNMQCATSGLWLLRSWTVLIWNVFLICYHGTRITQYDNDFKVINNKFFGTYERLKSKSGLELASERVHLLTNRPSQTTTNLRFTVNVK